MSVCQAGSWLLVIALGVKVSVCAVRVKQHFKVILKDEDDDDDLIDLYKRLEFSYEIMQTPLRTTFDTDTRPKLRKQGTVTLPKDPPGYTPQEDMGSDDDEPFEPYEKSGRVDRDTFVLGASAMHADGADGGSSMEMVVQSSDPQVVKRRISRMDAISEEKEQGSSDGLEAIPETEISASGKK